MVVTLGRGGPARRGLAKAAIWVIVGEGVGWFLARPVWHLLDVFSNPQATNTVLADLVVASSSDRLKLAVATGLVLSSPVWLHQLYVAAAPRLYRGGRRWVLLTAAVVLFGIAAALTVLTVRDFWWMYGGPLLSTGSYLAQAVIRLVVFGTLLQLPLFVVVRRLERRWP